MVLLHRFAGPHILFNPFFFREVLSHYDRISGTSLIEDVNRKRGLLLTDMNVSAKLKKYYNLRISTDPLRLRARVLKDPVIKFSCEQKSANNGSFDLRKHDAKKVSNINSVVTFASPATLSSYFVVDFSRDRRSCDEFIRKQLEVSARHGIQIPTAVKGLRSDDVTEVYQGRNAVDAVDFVLEVFTRAMNRAKDVYINNSTGTFGRGGAFFRTLCLDSEGFERECVVLPPRERGGKAGLLLDYNENSSYYFTHNITTGSGTVKARLQVKIQGTKSLIDPLDIRQLFDIRHHNGEISSLVCCCVVINLNNYACALSNRRPLRGYQTHG